VAPAVKGRTHYCEQHRGRTATRNRAAASTQRYRDKASAAASLAVAEVIALQWSENLTAALNKLASTLDKMPEPEVTSEALDATRDALAILQPVNERLAERQDARDAAAGIR
jgi:selenocysteine lyase/cysteine desulfurase